MLRHHGLTAQEATRLRELRSFFNLPPSPTDDKSRIVGLLKGSNREWPIHSGDFGGPWGGVHRGFNYVEGHFTPACGAGSGMTRYNRNHVETHAAAIMHEHQLKQGVLLIEKEVCRACSPNLFKIIPVDAHLTVVGPETAEHYWSSRG